MDRTLNSDMLLKANRDQVRIGDAVGPAAYPLGWLPIRPRPGRSVLFTAMLCAIGVCQSLARD